MQLSAERSEIRKLVDLLREEGYRVVAPVYENGVIRLREISSGEELPSGVEEDLGRGRYRAVEGKGESLFSHTNGPDSPKRFLHPPVLELLRVKPDITQEVSLPQGGYALFGIRACDVRAVGILEEVFLRGSFPDAHLRSASAGKLIVGVNCTQPSAVCFCGDMGTGPEITAGADLTVTEIGERVLLRAFTDRGREILSRLRGREPSPSELEEERRLLRRAEGKVSGWLSTEGLAEKLLTRLEDPRWEEIARVCLACGSCTMVCPTCFCYEVVDEISPDGGESVRLRRWDVCFRVGFSALHSRPLRPSTAHRYRQWLMHKFSYWVGQFGGFGCVGCGRCVVWCPVGIDIREEVRRLAEDG